MQLARERFEVEGEAGLALGTDGRGVGASDGDDRRSGLRQIEMRAEANADFVAGEEFGAGPMEDAAKVAALEEFNESVGEVFGGAGLSELVGVEFGRAARGPVGEQAFVQRAALAGAVAHEERSANGGRVVRRGGEHGLFTGELLRRVSIYRMRGIVRRVRSGELSVENLFGGKMEQAEVQFAGESGEKRGESDVQRFGPGGLGVALGGLGNRGAVDDRVGSGGAEGRGDGGVVGEIEGEATRESRKLAGETADDADELVAANGGETSEIAADETGGAGEENFHRERTTNAHEYETLPAIARTRRFQRGQNARRRNRAMLGC